MHNQMRLQSLFGAAHRQKNDGRKSFESKNVALTSGVARRKQLQKGGRNHSQELAYPVERSTSHENVKGSTPLLSCSDMRANKDRSALVIPKATPKLKMTHLRI